MIEDVYPADMAQLSYSLYAGESGLVVKGTVHKFVKISK